MGALLMEDTEKAELVNTFGLYSEAWPSEIPDRGGKR